MTFIKDRAVQVTDLPEEKNTIADSVIINTGIGIKKGEDYFDKAMKIGVPVILLSTLGFCIYFYSTGNSTAGTVCGLLFFNGIVVKELWRKKREDAYVSL
jgi:hypothetical protein